MIKFEDIRPGDKITLEVETPIRVDGDGDYCLKFKGGLAISNCIRPGSIVHHEPAPPEPPKLGEIWKFQDNTDWTYRIVGFDGDSVIFKTYRKGIFGSLREKTISEFLTAGYHR